MALDGVKATKAIIESYTESLLKSTDVDVALVGAGPANLVAAKRLAEADLKTVVFEKTKSIGGCLWGGSMMFPYIAVQQEGCRILEEFGIWCHERGEGYYIANSIEVAAKLTAGAVDAGAQLFNLISFEDVVIREDAVAGVLIKWTAAETIGLHASPLAVRSKFVIDGTGREAAVFRTISRKIPEAVGVEYEARTAMDIAQEIYPGLVVVGQAAAIVCGDPLIRLAVGDILLSGESAANLVIERLGA